SPAERLELELAARPIPATGAADDRDLAVPEVAGDLQLSIGEEGDRSDVPLPAELVLVRTDDVTCGGREQDARRDEAAVGALRGLHLLDDAELRDGLRAGRRR